MEMSQLKENLSGIYKELADILTFESVLLIHQHFKGQQVTFPAKLMSKDYVIQQIIKEYDGKNIKLLAKRHGYTERWVRKVIRNDIIKKKG